MPLLKMIKLIGWGQGVTLIISGMLGKPKVLRLHHNCDSTAIRLRHDYDEKLTCSFFARVESRRLEAGERDTS